MAVEQKRGCGYRKVGGLYFVGGYMSVPCDRIPYPLHVCPICGGGIKVGRGMTEINPLRLFGLHDNQDGAKICEDPFRPCVLCDPTGAPAYLMKVGEKFYPEPEDFLNEGVSLGFSKRISQIPHKFEVGKTVVYLAHPRACAVMISADSAPAGQSANYSGGYETTSNSGLPRLLVADRMEKRLGIFTAFVPNRIEKLYWQSELDKMTPEEHTQLERRGITPVGIPDGDKDHAPRGGADAED